MPLRAMRRLRLWDALLLSAAAAVLLSGCPGEEPAPRNVILMIADGCGYHHVDAAGLWAEGRTGTRIYEDFPVRLALATPPHGADPYDPDPIWSASDAALSGYTDSAAAITALGCGVKTRNGRLAVDPDGAPVTTVLELAEARGLATGVVSSVLFAHATPAGLLVHHPDREAYREIAAAMILDSAAEVIMGPGHPLFDDDGRAAPPDFKYVGGPGTWAAVSAGEAGADADGDGVPDPWTLIDDRAAFRALADGPAPRRVLGVAPARETLQQQRSGDAHAAPYDVPLTPSQPTLAEMTRAALNVLDDDPDGFVLMVEGGAIDWASHEGQSGRMIEEMLDFDAAVAAGVAWVEAHGGWDETLLLVTADHECGGLCGPVEYAGDTWPAPAGRGRGALPRMTWRTPEHTSHLVPLYARGAGARALPGLARGTDPRRGPYVDNADLGRRLCAWARGEAPAGDPDAVPAALVRR